jgi:hypothetical protein
MWTLKGQQNFVKGVWRSMQARQSGTNTKLEVIAHLRVSAKNSYQWVYVLEILPDGRVFVMRSEHKNNTLHMDFFYIEAHDIDRFGHLDLLDRRPPVGWEWDVSKVKYPKLGTGLCTFKFKKALAACSKVQ